jgi:hypothetical protein
MTARTVSQPTEYEIETRGMALAVDYLKASGEDQAATVLLNEVSRRIRAFHAAIQPAGEEVSA